MNTRFLMVLGVIIVVLAILKRGGIALSKGASGAIQNIRVDGVPIGRMGAHLVSKLPGARAEVQALWTGTTKNAAGAGITWFYRLSVTLFNAGNGSILAGPEFGPSTSATFNQSFTQMVPINVPISAAPGMFINVVVNLQVLTSDSNGNPTANWVSIEVARHDNAIKVGGAAQPSGTISPTVTVTQLLRRR